MADMAAIAVAAMALLAATVVAQPSLVSEQTFNDMLKHRDDSICPAHGFYTYAAFIAATNAFPDFANSGDTDTKKRELAAFFAHSSQETTGGSATAQDGPYAWGYCFKEEINHNTYCDTSKGWTCNPNKQYYGRGPLQLTWNYNYGNAGQALNFDGINNPEMVSQDATVAFKAALWFWMTPQSPKPSCHDVITGKFTPSPADTAAGRMAGFGLTTNIINGGVECGKGSVDSQNGRIGFFRRYCTILGITPGDNLDCNSQQPYPS